MDPVHHVSSVHTVMLQAMTANVIGQHSGRSLSRRSFEVTGMCLFVYNTPLSPVIHYIN